MDVIAGAAAVPDAPNVLLAAAAAAVLCGLVIAEIAALPGVLLPGGTMTLLAGALIGSGRPAARRSATVSTPRRQTGKLARRAAADCPGPPGLVQAAASKASGPRPPGREHGHHLARSGPVTVPPCLQAAR